MHSVILIFIIHFLPLAEFVRMPKKRKYAHFQQNRLIFTDQTWALEFPMGFT